MKKMITSKKYILVPLAVITALILNFTVIYPTLADF